MLPKFGKIAKDPDAAAKSRKHVHDVKVLLAYIMTKERA